MIINQSSKKHALERKTAEQWADYLPEPIRMQFLEACKQKNNLQCISYSLAESIRQNIRWYDTKQGVDYWHRIYNNAYHGVYQLPLNKTLSKNAE